MASTIPACNGRAVAEGFTYKIRDPRSGEIVAIHAARGPDGKIAPDRDADDLVLALRVAALPGDQIEGRDGSVFVNGIKLDDIETQQFPQVEVGGEQYFVLGDNRSAAVDSRTFGPVLRNAIFAKVFVVFWPLRDFTFRTDPESGVPPGPVDCG
jgi:signal peptidase I